MVDDGVNGLLLPVKDAPALAQAMMHMIEAPALRERMGKAGREKVEREFDEQIVLEKILKVYMRSLVRSGASAAVPPTKIAREATWAKPQRAYVVMTADRAWVNTCCCIARQWWETAPAE